MLDGKQKEVKFFKETIENLKSELVEAKKQIKQTGDKTIMDRIYQILDSLDEETKKII